MENEADKAIELDHIDQQFMDEEDQRMSKLKKGWHMVRDYQTKKDGEAVWNYYVQWFSDTGAYNDSTSLSCLNEDDADRVADFLNLKQVTYPWVD